MTGSIPEPISVHSAPRLDALTVLRFVAAAMIVVGHATSAFGNNLGAAFPYLINSCVSFFFVLSGFILRYNYPQLLNRHHVAGFYVLRLARIWPVHLLTLAMMAATMAYGHSLTPGIDPWLAATLSGSLLQSWFPLIGGYMGAYNGPAWTLSVDVFFYAVFPWLLVRVHDAPGRTVAGTLCLSLAGPVIANALGGPRSDLPMDQWNWYLLDHSFPLSRLAEFALGMATAEVWTRRRVPLALGRSAGTALEVAAIAVIAAAATRLPDVPYLATWVGSGVADWLTQIAMAPCYAFLIAVIACNRGWISRLLALPFARYLGELSFAVYMLHVPLLVFPLWATLYAARGWPAIALFWIVLWALADIVWRGFEVPARRWIIRHWTLNAEAPRPVPNAPV